MGVSAGNLKSSMFLKFTMPATLQGHWARTLAAPLPWKSLHDPRFSKCPGINARLTNVWLFPNAEIWYDGISAIVLDTCTVKPCNFCVIAEVARMDAEMVHVIRVHQANILSSLEVNSKSQTTTFLSESKNASKVVTRSKPIAIELPPTRRLSTAPVETPPSPLSARGDIQGYVCLVKTPPFSFRYTSHMANTC